MWQTSDQFDCQHFLCSNCQSAKSFLVGRYHYTIQWDTIMISNLLTTLSYHVYTQGFFLSITLCCIRYFVLLSIITGTCSLSICSNVWDGPSSASSGASFHPSWTPSSCAAHKWPHSHQAGHWRAILGQEWTIPRDATRKSRAGHVISLQTPVVRHLW